MFPARPFPFPYDPALPNPPFPPRYDCSDTLVGVKHGGEATLYNHYTKDESDALYAAKSTETAVVELQSAVAGKASAADLEELTQTVSEKASGQEAVDIRARLDALEYKPIVIDSFTASPTLAEMGSSVNVALAWSLNKAATAQTIGDVSVTGSSYTVQNVAQNTTWELNVTDGQTSASKTASIAFQNGVYYGAAPDLTSVTTLTKVLSGTKSRTITVNAGAGDYIIYAIPKRIGTVEFYVNGFEGGFDEPVEQNLTNASGYTETYRVYKSTNANLGETTVEVR